MELLSKEQRVHVLKYAKELLKIGSYSGMCYCIEKSLGAELDGRSCYVIANYIKGFNPTIAMKKFGATRCGGYWWAINDIESRLKYFDWLIELNNQEDVNG